MTRLPALATLPIVALLATPVQAEFIFGGELTVERDVEEFQFVAPDTQETELRGEVAVGYDAGEFAFAIGTRFVQDHDNFELDEDDAFYFARFGPVSLVHGRGVGAGNMLSKNNFAIDDITDDKDVSTRLELDLDALTLAISVDENDDVEVGLSTMLGNHFVRAGIEGGTEEFQLLVGRDMGKWGYHLIAHNDAISTGREDQFAATLLYDVTDALQIAGNIAIGGDGELHSYGLLGWYTLGGDPSSLGPATLRFEYIKEFDAIIVGDFESAELSLNIPFGKKASGLYERKTNKEDLSGFGF